jgi:DNA methylase
MPRPAPPTRVPETTDVPISWVPLTTVRPHPRNDGRHPPDELAHLKQSIIEHDIYRNVVLANDDTILAGHGVVQAAQELGHTQILARRMPYGPDDPQALKILVGDNHIARLRMQDDAALVAVLQDLAQHDPLALLGTGFDAEALEALVAAQGLGNGTEDGNAGRDAEPQINRAEELRNAWGVEAGQLWALGNHRVICGDCTEKVVVEGLLQDMVVQAIVTDPPYGLHLETNFTETTGRTNAYTTLGGKARRLRAYPRLYGDAAAFDRRRMPLEAAEEFWFGADYYVDTLPNCGKDGSWLVWDKREEGTVDSMRGSAFELCWSKCRHRRELMRIVWAGVLGHVKAYDGSQKFHPTQKPVALFRWLLERFTESEQVVFDGFLGSGATLIACENLQRLCYGCEIDPGYVAVTLQRWTDVTGEQPQRLA